MLASLMKSVLPHRFLFPQRRRFRDRPVMKRKGAVPIVRLLGFCFGGILLAGLVLVASATLRAPAAQSLHVTVASAEQAASGRSDTDGRAAPEEAALPRADRLPHPLAARIDRDCAEHARERLMGGLTHYYLQRRLRPGAGLEDVANTSNMTGLLAGPGDPASTIPATSCAG